MTREIISISQKEQIKTSSMWIGSKQISTYQMYLYNSDTNTFNLQEIKYPPGLYKLIDEAIVNTSDHWTTYPKLVSKIEINFDNKTGVIKILNNGPSIGITKKKNINGEEMYVAQMAASDFNSSSNYNKKRYGGGAHGAGLKLISCFSKWLEIETVEIKKKKKYWQKFENQLDIINEPIITDMEDEKEDYTSIRFLPAYDVFGYEGGYKPKYANDLFKLIELRSYHLAVYTNINVFLNNKKIEYSEKDAFIQFSKMHITENDIYCTKLIHEENEPEWDICIGISDGKFQHISIINGVFIGEGGNYIKAILNQIVDALQPKVEKILKPAKVKFNRNMITNSLFLFIKGKMANPEFDSQIKNKIMNPIENFAKYKFRAKDWKPLWELVGSQIEATFLSKTKNAENKRVIRGEVNVPKSEDAQWAGGKHSSECILWIAEGDSACGTLQKGIAHKCSILNNKFCGTFNIGGVPVNCRAHSTEKINPKTQERVIIQNKTLKENERITSLLKILGLRYDRSYDGDTEEGLKEIQTLRYGSVIIIVDQDVDGHGIFGMLLNFFEFFWPNLVKIGFIKKFNTPIIRAFTLNRSGVIDKKANVLEFFTMTQFKKWINKEFNGQEDKAQTKFFIKYYKGLGTHTDGDIPKMFSDYEINLLCTALDKMADENLSIFYGKDTTAKKNVLRTPADEIILTNPMNVTNILHSMVKEFHRDKISRSLPHVMDGLTESRRKVLWTARNIFGKSMSVKNQVKVQSLAADTTKLTAYMHGEQCLADTIILMGQMFPGSNHLPLLIPHGHFGSRKFGGKDAASSRYIYTQLNSVLCYALCPADDDYLLEFVFDEGQRCEPKYFIPILPMAILEHLQGNIGVGWATTIWARDIQSVFKNVRGLITGNQEYCYSMKTWLKNNTGDIRFAGGKEYSVGKYKYDSKKETIYITELPLGMYPRGFLELNKEKPSESKLKMPLWARTEFSKKPLCESSNEQIDITLYLKQGEYEKIMKKYGTKDFDPIEDYLGLRTALHSNINCIGYDDNVLEFNKYEKVVDVWFKKRKELYELRIQRQIILLKLNIMYLRNIIRFMDSESKYGFTTKTELDTMNSILEKEKYDKINETLLKSPKFTPTELLEELILRQSSSYNYLLTLNNIDKSAGNSKKRKELLNNKEKELKELENSIKKDIFPGASIWLKELDTLEKIINEGFKTNWGLE
jgi:DNA topoisomerase-2